MDHLFVSVVHQGPGAREDECRGATSVGDRTGRSHQRGGSEPASGEGRANMTDQAPGSAACSTVGGYPACGKPVSELRQPPASVSHLPDRPQVVTWEDTTNVATWQDA